MKTLRQKIDSYLKKLPKGKVTTYKALAEKFNSHPHAVARILATNKDRLAPCYKVIKSNRELGGYNELLGKSKQQLIQEYN